MTYYKGTIVSTSDDAWGKTNIDTLGYLDSFKGNKFIELRNNNFKYHKSRISSNDIPLTYFIYDINDKYQECNDEKIINFMNKIVPKKDILFRKNYKDIIYEKVEDNDGNMYAKELITGLCFPIYDKKMDLRNYSFKKEIKYVEYIYFLEKTTLKVPNTDKCECIVTYEKVADNNEVMAYREQFNKGLFKKSKERSFINEIELLYNKNVFSKDPEFKTKEEKEKAEKQQQNKETLMMENIEYMLQKLQAVDEELYNAYQGKYNEIIYGDFTCLSLASLEGELEFHLMMGKTSAEDITKYLESLKIEYLEKVLTGKEMGKDLTIKDIDRFEDIVLKVKDKYSLVTQRRVLKDLAFLYLLEVYENKDLISDYDFSDSYFASNLKTIVIIVKSLINLGVIENNISIEINDEISLDNVLDIISKIEFNKAKKEDINRLIMSI